MTAAPGPDPEFDPTFDFATDSPVGKDPDAYSPTLRQVHKTLWSKSLNSGAEFKLEAPTRRSNGYLIRTSKSGDRLWFGSDAITNSYARWTRPKALAEAVASLNAEQGARYLNRPYTAASAMIWPVRSKDRPTINQARGTRSKIADRMDLTLECIRRHYIDGSASPLSDVLEAYGDFFALFEDFREFVDFFHFQDLVTENYESVNFYIPLEDFTRAGTPRNLEEYISYREATLLMIEKRARRMSDWVGAAAG